MSQLKVMSLNGEDMIDLIPKDLNIPGEDSFYYWRAKLLAAMIQEADPDIVGLVEAPPDQIRTEKFVESYLGGAYKVHQGEKRGALGLAFLVKNNRSITVNIYSKTKSL